jgi:hypothetical protein
MEIVVYGIFFEIIDYTQFSTKIIWKNNFCAFFQYYFLYVLIVSKNLVSKYEQLLTLTDIVVSTFFAWLVYK